MRGDSKISFCYNNLNIELLIMIKRNLKKGFTLVELAIVLVVIGLITGGVLAGSELIQASKISSVAAEMQKYQTAYNKYKEQYGAAPGDHSRAYDYWGTDCASTEGACNGDGDRSIEGFALSGESVMFFRHLFLADMIDEDLSGTGTLEIGTNLPTLDMTGITLAVHSLQRSTLLSAGGFNIGPKANFITTAKLNSSAQPYDPQFTPAIAKKIDTKLDDGSPGTGNFIATGGSSCVNYSGSNMTTLRNATYKLTVTTDVCGIAAKMEEPV